MTAETPTARPCPTPAVSPIPEASLPDDLDHLTREALRIRTQYGLRHDLAWIRDVAADPTATDEFGTPLLASESAALFGRNALPEPVKAALDRYGHVDEFGGLYIDNAAGGFVVVLWTGDTSALEAALRVQLPRCHKVAFRQVRWSELELRRWQDRIAADVDWMETIPARWTSVGVNVSENTVEVDVSSSVLDVADRVIAHYNAPDGMIRVTSDGTGAHLLPYGTVIGRVLRADGSPPGRNSLMLDAGSSDDPPGWCGGGDVGYGVLEDGSFEYPCRVGRRTILLRGPTPAVDGSGVVAAVVVVVPANGIVRVEIRLPPDFDPSATE
jgi:hypothetical protein